MIVVATTYCGNLVAFLTFPQMDTPITTVGKLVKNTKGITWGMQTGTFLIDYLKVSLSSLWLVLINHLSELGNGRKKI